jgi:methionyl-tRNA formyltransferase
MQMEAGLDTGPVLMREATAIGETETTGALHDRLSVLGAGLIVKALERLDDLVAEPQRTVGVTYAEKIDKAEARIDWKRPAEEVLRLIHGLSPFPGAWCDIAGERIKMLQAELAEGSGAPGEVLDDSLRVACGSGAIRLKRLQRAGKAAQDADVFLRGWPVARGTRI